MRFPEVRLRRLRSTEARRNMFNDIKIHSSQLIYPLFVDENIKRLTPISAMPGQYRHPLDGIQEEVSECVKKGIFNFILFGLPSKKYEHGDSAHDRKGVIQEAVQKLKAKWGEKIVVMTDLCLCQYTTHGHCGVVKDGVILNDVTLDVLGKIAVSQANAGADVVAPSAMIDGQVKVIRSALNEAGFSDTIIMPYSAKHASCFYGPFREAASSSPIFGDRRSYQMDYASSKQAIREIELDVMEGADIIMVKPSLAYLDLIVRASQIHSVPIAAFNVSGEYSMVKAAVMKGWLNEEDAVVEILTGIKRSGADLIITYFAKDASSWLSRL